MLKRKDPGPPPVAEIAAALAEREATVRYGIEWFNSKDVQLENLIRASLAETAAYRALSLVARRR